MEGVKAVQLSWGSTLFAGSQRQTVTQELDVAFSLSVMEGSSCLAHGCLAMYQVMEDMTENRICCEITVDFSLLSYFACLTWMQICESLH